uniref:Uncharacterized protein n=1 Tax=Anopheles minimus TaxID=112268 RepID=A0A182WM12_9DIPT
MCLYVNVCMCVWKITGRR